LQEKGIEAQIKKASNIADNQIIEKARFFGIVKPETTKIYPVGLLLAILLPLLYLFFKDFFNNKIETREDITQLTRIPVFGSITESKEDVDFVTMEKPRSPTAEAFRALRTRITFLTRGQSQQTIMVSSSISGEGKTFCAVNLAGIIALSGKKTIILGMDLRKPRLYDYFKTESEKGITNFLINDSTLEEIIQSTGYPNLDCILSGPIPPNPAELITSEKMAELFKRLKDIYDYIIS
jgi:Mrp family chromosome partitioning ATPase